MIGGGITGCRGIAEDSIHHNSRSSYGGRTSPQFQRGMVRNEDFEIGLEVVKEFTLIFTNAETVMEGMLPPSSMTGLSNVIVWGPMKFSYQL